jgi:hypothetical protein
MAYQPSNDRDFVDWLEEKSNTSVKSTVTKVENTWNIPDNRGSGSFYRSRPSRSSTRRGYGARYTRSFSRGHERNASGSSWGEASAHSDDTWGGNTFRGARSRVRQIGGRPRARSWYRNDWNNSPRSSTSNQEFQKVQEMLSDMQREMKELHDRLDNKPPAASTTQGTSSNSLLAKRPDNKSDNPDFPELIKALYNMGRIRFQKKNWASMPRSVEAKINDMLGSLNPILIDESFKHEVDQLKEAFKTEVCKLFSNFFNRKLSELEDRVNQLDTLDLDEAGRVAVHYLTRKDGPRLPLALAQDLIGASKHFLNPCNQGACQDPTGLGLTDSEYTDSELTNNLIELASAAHATTKGQKRKQTEISPAQNLLDNPSTSISSLSVQQPEKRDKRMYDVLTLPSGVLEHNPKNKTDWQPSALASKDVIIVLGDSNLCRLNKVPTGTIVNALRGARISHLTSAISNMNFYHPVTMLLMAGINDRDADPKLTAESMQDLLAMCDKLGKQMKIYMQLVPIPNTLQPDAVERLRALNDEIAAGFGNTFAVPPPSNLEMESSKQEEIHFTPRCMADILGQALDFIKQPMSVGSSPTSDA